MRTKEEIQKAYDELFAKFCEKKVNVNSFSANSETLLLAGKCLALGWVLRGYEEL